MSGDLEPSLRYAEIIFERHDYTEVREVAFTDAAPESYDTTVRVGVYTFRMSQRDVNTIVARKLPVMLTLLPRIVFLPTQLHIKVSDAPKKEN